MTGGMKQRWLLAGSLGLLAGCAARSAAPSTAIAQDATSYHRIVDDFDVRDDAGDRYAHPFLGGLNVPRPQLIDIDADGDLDLFVQERGGEVMFFEQVGTVAQPRYAWRSDAFQDINVGEWYRFADIDADGDYDLLGERRFSYISYWRNEGTPEAAAFVLAADTLRDVTGKALFSDRQNIPNVSDLDCDGRLDLFIGRLVGTISRYEADGVDANDVPRFRHITDRFEDIEIVANPVGSRHGANTMSLADIDRDGDLDLFWGDFFEQGLLFIENSGTCASPRLNGDPVQFPVGDPVLTSGYNAMAFGDVYADGNLDLVLGVLGGAFNPNLTTADNLFFLRQEPTGTFTITTERYLKGVDVGSESIPRLVDLDDDGDLDLLLANKIDPDALQSSRVYRFENIGDARNPVFHRRGAMPWDGQYHYAPDFGDLDGDGDLDMVLGSWRNVVAYYENTGSRAEPDFTEVTPELVKITRGSNTTPALVDIDGDGDLDLFVGEASGALNYYQNTGTASAPSFLLMSDEFQGIDVGRRSNPVFQDLDGDQDYDLVVGTESDGLQIFENIGSPTVPQFQMSDGWPIKIPDYSAPAFGDLDGDGAPELLIGGIGGGLLYYQHR
jgi:hypothetical protein